MAIKPLVKNDKFLFLKIFLLGSFVAGALLIKKATRPKREILRGKTLKKKQLNIKENLASFIDQAGEKVGETVSNVLGETTSVIVNTATKSAQAVSEFILDSTVGNIIKQVDKLPKHEQEKIKEYICQ